MTRKLKSYEWTWYWAVALDDTKFRERRSKLYKQLDKIFHTERFTIKEKIGNEDELYIPLEAKI